MKYTRYNLNKKKTNGAYFLTVVVAVVIISIVFGTLISNLVMKDKLIEISNSYEKNQEVDSVTESVDESADDSEGAIVIDRVDEQKDDSTTADSQTTAVDSKVTSNNYYLVQCGAFQDENNAINLSSQLVGIGSCIIVEKDNVYKVVLGIYNHEDYTSMESKLEAANIDYSRSKVTFNDNISENEEILKVLNANYEIISQFENKKVESIKSDSIKSWIASFEESNIDVKDQNLIKLIEFTKSLPASIEKDYIKEYKTFLYNFVSEYK